MFWEAMTAILEASNNNTYFLLQLLHNLFPKKNLQTFLD